MARQKRSQHRGHSRVRHTAGQPRTKFRPSLRRSVPQTWQRLACKRCIHAQHHLVHHPCPGPQQRAVQPRRQRAHRRQRRENGRRGGGMVIFTYQTCFCLLLYIASLKFQAGASTSNVVRHCARRAVAKRAAPFTQENAAALFVVVVPRLQPSVRSCDWHADRDASHDARQQATVVCEKRACCIVIVGWLDAVGECKCIDAHIAAACF